MKKILFVLFLPLFGISQNDTIFKIDNKIIPCTITLANEGAVFYKDKKGYGDECKNSKIKYYSLSGKRIIPIDPAFIDYKLFKIDTTRNELGQLKLSKVFEYKDTTLSKNKLYERVKEFIYKSYVSGDDVKLYEDKESGKFFCEAITQKLIYNSTMVSCNGGYFKYKMTIYVKDKKVKIVIDNITHYRGECPMESNDGSDFGDLFPSKWNTIAKKYDIQQFHEFKSQAFKEFTLIFNYLDKINSSKKDDGDF